MAARFYIGEVAWRAQVSVQTVRYYERLGLLPSAQRAESRYRIYTPEVVHRLQFIRQAQALGFRLEEIREILRMKYAGRSPCSCVCEMLRQKLTDVEKQLKFLDGFRRRLRRTLERARKQPHLPHRVSSICPLIETPSLVRKNTKKGGETQ